MSQRFLKLNKITPTNDYYDATEFRDINNIDINIIYDRPDFLKIYKKSKNNKGPQRTTKNHKEPRKNNKRKKWAFLLKFINCLKC